MSQKTASAGVKRGHIGSHEARLLWGDVFDPLYITSDVRVDVRHIWVFAVFLFVKRDNANCSATAHQRTSRVPLQRGDTIKNSIQLLSIELKNHFSEKTDLTESFFSFKSTCTDHIVGKFGPTLLTGRLIYDGHIHHPQGIHRVAPVLRLAPSSHRAQLIFFQVHVHLCKWNGFNIVALWSFFGQLQTQMF